MTPTQTAESLPRKMIPISRITRDANTQCRVKLNPLLVDEYAELIEAHGHMDPIVVFTENPTDIKKSDPIIMADGFHRAEAYLKAGKEQIPCEVRPGGKSEALEYGISTGSRNGQRFSNADKRKCAELAVEDLVMAAYADGKIAKMIGVSVSLVSDCRRGITKEEKRRRKGVVVSKHRRAAPEPKTKTPKDLENRPTAVAAINVIQGYLDDGILDELDIIQMFETAQGEWKWLPKSGGDIGLKIIGGKGKPQVDVTVKVKQVSPEYLVLRYEGEGRMSVAP